MKNLLLLLIILFSSCKSSQNLSFTLNEVVTLETENCPDNGICTIELIPNKSLVFKQDDFGNSYPIITEGDKTIFKYTYTRNPIPNTQDSNYTEIIYAELDKTISEINLHDSQLQNLKLYFGRLCFCKGETGYYPIKNGEFKISKTGRNAINIDFKFIIKEVPQIISEINETISLKSSEPK